MTTERMMALSSSTQDSTIATSMPGDSRRPYQAPRLVAYGPLKTLTTGGTQHAQEGTPDVGQGKWRP
jgi:hypothetical protein